MSQNVARFRISTSSVGLPVDFGFCRVLGMAREQYRTPDEDVAAEFDRVCQLFQLALGQASDRVLFDSLMLEASDQGMNWVQGLEYVIEQRRSASRPDIAEVPRRPAVSAGFVQSDDDLLRAG